MSRLDDVSTEALQNELRARQRCIRCHTEHSSGWHAVPKWRIMCDDCYTPPEPPQVVDERQIPLLTDGAVGDREEQRARMRDV